MTDFGQLFGDCRLMAILRGLSPAETVNTAVAAWDLGIDLVEVPIGTLGDQLQALQATAKEARDSGRVVGAGTVLTPDHARAAADAGAAYTVAPGFDAAVLRTSVALGLPHLPGVATATEVHHARAAGCLWLKAFPADSLGAGWFRAMLGPFPDVQLVATGGITPNTARTYLAAGARIVALGAGITNPAHRTELQELIDELAQPRTHR